MPLALGCCGHGTDTAMNQKITNKVIAGLQPPSSGNEIIYDEEVPGFGVRITAAGVVSFVLNYRVHGRERRLTIGRHPELTAMAARDRAVQFRARIRDGHDPLAEREAERQQATVEILGETYLRTYAATHNRPSSVRNDKSMIEKIINVNIGELRVSAVTRQDVEALHRSLKKTPYRANRVLALVSSMFNRAVEWEWVERNPAKGIPKFHEEPKQTWLTVDQINSFMIALDHYSDKRAADALRLMLWTGARKNEVLQSDWSHFDLDRAIWTKPSHHTKQKRTEHYSLGNEALQLLKRIRPKNATGPVFPGEDGKARTTIYRPWLQCCRAAGLVRVEERKGKRKKTILIYKPSIRIHDLRHTFASHLVSNGVSLHIVGRMLGHTQPQTTARYAHVADDALRDAADLFGRLVKRTTANG